MIEYSKFYEMKRLMLQDDSSKTEENIHSKSELEEYIELIQKLDYAHFDD